MKVRKQRKDFGWPYCLFLHSKEGSGCFLETSTRSFWLFLDWMELLIRQVLSIFSFSDILSILNGDFSLLGRVRLPLQDFVRSAVLNGREATDDNLNSAVEHLSDDLYYFLEETVVSFQCRTKCGIKWQMTNAVVAICYCVFIFQAEKWSAKCYCIYQVQCILPFDF